VLKKVLHRKTVKPEGGASAEVLSLAMKSLSRVLVCVRADASYVLLVSLQQLNNFRRLI
jgi:hypothetical protein